MNQSSSLKLKFLLAFLVSASIGLLTANSLKEMKHYRLQKYDHKTEIDISDFKENSKFYYKKEELNIRSGFLFGFLCFTVFGGFIIISELSKRDKFQLKINFKKWFKVLAVIIGLFFLGIVVAHVVRKLKHPRIEQPTLLKAPENLDDLYHFLIKNDKSVDWGTRVEFFDTFKDSDGSLSSRQKLHTYLTKYLVDVSWDEWDLFNEKYVISSR